MQLQPESSRKSQIPPALNPAEVSEEITNLTRFSTQVAPTDEAPPTQVSANISAALARWDWESAQLELNNPKKTKTDFPEYEPSFVGVDPALLAETALAADQARQAKLDEERINLQNTENIFTLPESSVVVSIKALIDDYNQRMARAAMPWEPSVNYLPELLRKAQSEQLSEELLDIPIIDASAEKTNPDQSVIKKAHDPVIEVSSEIISEEDLLLPLTLENLPKRNKLNAQEIGDLYALLLAHSDKQELWNFLSRCTSHPINAWVIRYNLIHNTGFITPDTLESILLLGPVQDEVEMAENSQKKQIIMYGSTNLGKGGQAEVAEVFYLVLDDNFATTDLDNANLKLSRGAIKIAFLDNQVSKENLHYEQTIAKEVTQIIKSRENSGESFDASKHIALPTIYGEGFYILPIIEVSPGQSASLFQYGKTFPETKPFVQQMIGPFKVLNLLDQHNIINCDTTDNNILISTDGGVMIDLGGFISQSQIQAGNVLLLKKPSSDLHVAAFKNGTMFESPAFTSNHIFAHELLNPQISGLTHKIALGRMIERYLTMAGYQTVEYFKRFNDANLEEKLAHQPDHIPDDRFSNPDHRTLYELCKVLLKSMYHPTPYHNNNPLDGQDDQYISLEEAILILEDIANN